MKIVKAFGVGLVLGTIGLAAFGCSSSNSGSGSRSGVTESKTIVSLTDSDRKALCDWIANTEGGYGHKTTKTCDGGTVTETATKDQATCVADLASAPAACQATVQQSEDCVQAQAAADLCSLTTSVPAACAPLFTTECKGG